MLRVGTLTTAAALLFLAACARNADTTPDSTPNPLRLDPRPTSEEISARDLMTRLYIFADDSMQGRATGTEGYARGTRYIASELERLGLTPMGDDGSYFQSIPFGSRKIAVEETLTLSGAQYIEGTDVHMALPQWSPRDFGGGLVIYGGWASERLNPGLLNRTVVIAMPGDSSIAELAPGGRLSRASMVLFVIDGQAPAAITRMMRDSTVGFRTGMAAEEGPMVGTLTRAAAERMFGKPLAQVSPGTEITGSPLNGLVVEETRQYPAHNVVAVIPGSDPALAGQYVAIGAHADHVGLRRGGPVDHDSLRAINAAAWQLSGAYPGSPRLDVTRRQALTVNVDSLRELAPARPDSIHNGADDDGSGSMALLEIAEHLALSDQKPRRSILFVWHAGEEMGLVGAGYFVENPTVPLDSIVAQVNIDMIGRGGAEDMRNGGPDYLALVGSRRLSTQLGDMVESVNSASDEPLRFDYTLDADGHPENLYCRSDHFHYARMGIPVVFLFTGLHGDYHQVTDEPQYIAYPHYARITRFANNLISEVANADRAPVVDKPVPDPNARCRQ
ncbi:MAG TPA: M28 family peptidase [Gemmatimonadales bacterium]|nr:M28 family peptidase [Gemmatimonadales bacterium]